MQKKFDNLLKARELTLKAISGLTNEQINTIPKGFNNNIAWNVAHLVVTQQVLCYKLSGLDCLVSDDMIDNFRKGSSPTSTISEGEFETIKNQLLAFPVTFSEDYEKGIFKNYTSYPTSTGIVLDSIDDVIDFNLFHEGIHVGIILQLKKLV